jgi:lipopolysaccharide transport system ATP-binding protein
MSTVIKVENVSKQYRLGLVGTGTLRDDLEGWWYRVRGKEDPTLKLGEENNRAVSGDSNYVWALRDINFDVQQGEVLGIIGKNGAGKSTLLKLLSRVTAPTLGNIKVKGRIASLLEVGTGFHPELTGRDNIYLNGAIMGMKRHEITRKLDEIVDFAGVERYLETPVKRYSSGMYVRLAFAVAAHLEPEILIVDEVLAVGDAEFQKKALGKMKEVSSGGGRTVLFVSHNMASVRSLCTSAILLRNGKIGYSGSTESVITNYLSGDEAPTRVLLDTSQGHHQLHAISITAVDKYDSASILREDAIAVILDYTCDRTSDSRFDFTVRFKADSGDVFMVSSTIFQNRTPVLSGKHKISVVIPPNFFNDGQFTVDVLFVENQRTVVGEWMDVANFIVVPEVRESQVWMGRTAGYVRPDLQWKII